MFNGPGTNYFTPLNDEVSIALTTNAFTGDLEAVMAMCTGNPNVVATDSGIFINGCFMFRADLLTGNSVYINQGTLASPDWVLIGSGSGSINIGDPIGGGDPYDILFVDGDGNLDQNDNFVYDPDDGYFKVGFVSYIPFYGDAFGNVAIGDYEEDFMGGDGIGIVSSTNQVFIGNDSTTSNTRIEVNSATENIILTATNVILPELAGFGSGFVAVDNTGLLSWSIGSGGSTPNLSAVLTAGNSNGSQAITGTNLFQSTGKNEPVISDTFGNAVMSIDNDDNILLTGFINGTSTPGDTLGFDGSTGALQIRDSGEALGYVLTSDATGIATWQPAPAGSLAIGDPVTGGTPSLILYVDDSGNLGQNSLFNFDPSAGTYNVEAGSSSFSQIGTTGTTTISSFGLTQLSVSDNTGIQQFGDIDGDWAFDLLYIDGPNRKITLQDSGANYLSLDMDNKLYQLGDTSGANNGTTLSVDDVNSISYFTNRWSQAKGTDVASAGSLTLGNGGNYFEISGTTTINFISDIGWKDGSVVTLYFQGSLNLTNNDGSGVSPQKPMFLAGSEDATTAAGSAFSFIYDSSLGSSGAWQEINRTYPSGNTGGRSASSNGYQLRNNDGTITIANGTLTQEAITAGQLSANTTDILGDVAASYAPISTTPTIIASNMIQNQSAGITGVISDSGHAPVDNGNYVINAWLTIQTITLGTVTVTFSYVDSDGNSQTLTLANAITVPGVYRIPPVPISLAAGSTFSLSSSVTGTVLYDFGGSLVYYPMV